MHGSFRGPGRVAAGVLGLSLALGLTGLTSLNPTDAAASARGVGVDVLLLLSENYGANYFINRDLFEVNGWNLVTAGVVRSIPACPLFRDQAGVPPIRPDVLVSEITDLSGYDAIAIMPASSGFSPDPFRDLLDSAAARKLLADAAGSGLPLSAICSGVRVLAAAGVLRGKKVVGEPKFRAEYEAAGASFLGKDHPPMIEGGVVTGARDMYYNFANVQAIATAIESRQPRGARERASAKPSIVEGVAGLSGEGLAWARTYGGAEAEGARAACPAPDGGFLLAGYTFSHEGGDADILVIRTDSEGRAAWSRAFGGAGTEYANGCAAVEDGFLIAGYTTSFGAGSKDVYLLKIDGSGKEIWERTYGGAGWDVGAAVAPARDGGIAVAGFTSSSGAGEEDVLLVRTDRSGKEIASRTYGGERSEIGASIAATPDGGFIIAATTGTYGQGNNDFYLIRTGPDGSPLWTKSYGNSGRRGLGFDWCSSMRPTRDGGYVLAGHTDKADFLDVNVVKLDAEGVQAWSRSFGGSPFYDYGNAISETEKGGYLIAGTSKSPDGDNDILVAEMDGGGEVVWQATFGGPRPEWGAALAATRDGAHVVAGQTASWGKGSFDVLLVKVRPPAGAAGAVRGEPPRPAGPAQGG